MVTACTANHYMESRGAAAPPPMTWCPEQQQQQFRSLLSLAPVPDLRFPDIRLSRQLDQPICGPNPEGVISRRLTSGSQYRPDKVLSICIVLLVRSEQRRISISCIHQPVAAESARFGVFVVIKCPPHHVRRAPGNARGSSPAASLLLQLWRGSVQGNRVVLVAADAKGIMPTNTVCQHLSRLQM